MSRPLHLSDSVLREQRLPENVTDEKGELVTTDMQSKGGVAVYFGVDVIEGDQVSEASANRVGGRVESRWSHVTGDSVETFACPPTGGEVPQPATMILLPKLPQYLQQGQGVTVREQQRFGQITATPSKGDSFVGRESSLPLAANK